MAQKKNQIGENGGERKKNPSANPDLYEVSDPISKKIKKIVSVCCLLNLPIAWLVLVI